MATAYFSLELYVLLHHHFFFSFDRMKKQKDSLAYLSSESIEQLNAEKNSK